jgi:hypothetical protein
LWRQREDTKAHEERVAGRKSRREAAEADHSNVSSDTDDEKIYTFMDDKVIGSE